MEAAVLHAGWCLLNLHEGEGLNLPILQTRRSACDGEVNAVFTGDDRLRSARTRVDAFLGSPHRQEYLKVSRLARH
jgi:hypothetical protein